MFGLVFAAYIVSKNIRILSVSFLSCNSDDQGLDPYFEILDFSIFFWDECAVFCARADEVVTATQFDFCICGSVCKRGCQNGLLYEIQTIWKKIRIRCGQKSMIYP